MFTDINEYIKFSKETRQAHLKLSEPCIEIGGRSDYFRGLLCFILKTTMANNRKICLCHACHNDKCGNPYHMYWGTHGENHQDALDNPNTAKAKSWGWKAVVNKYGEEEAKRIRLEASRKGGLRNKNKAKSKEHRENIRKFQLQKNKQGGA